MHTCKSPCTIYVLLQAKRALWHVFIDQLIRCNKKLSRLKCKQKLWWPEEPIVTLLSACSFVCWIKSLVGEFDWALSRWPLVERAIHFAYKYLVIWVYQCTNCELQALMAASSPRIVAFFFLVSIGSAQLSSTFYDTSCPAALPTIRSAVMAAVVKERRVGASLLRLHFHDCFVNVRRVRYGVD